MVDTLTESVTGVDQNPFSEECFKFAKLDVTQKESLIELAPNLILKAEL